jgi:hypothetical protein
LLGLHVGSTDDDISNSMSDSKDKGYVDYYYVRSTSIRCYCMVSRVNCSRRFSTRSSTLLGTFRTHNPIATNRIKYHRVIIARIRIFEILSVLG